MTISQISVKIPPLNNGDRLSITEFEKRYQAISKHQKAELIEGIVYMASPLRFESHAEPHSNLIGWLWTYRNYIPKLRLGIEPTMRLDWRNEPQPDAVLFKDQSIGGKTIITKDDYLEGSPELVAEIAASSVGYDLYDKKQAYCRNQIQEYLVWEIYENKLNWFSYSNQEYINLIPNNQGIIKSQVFPGLWLDVAAFLQGDMSQVLSVLQQGLQDISCQNFKQKLNSF